MFARKLYEGMNQVTKSLFALSIVNSLSLCCYCPFRKFYIGNAVKNYQDPISYVSSSYNLKFLIGVSFFIVGHVFFFHQDCVFQVIDLHLLTPCSL